MIPGTTASYIFLCYNKRPLGVWSRNGAKAHGGVRVGSGIGEWHRDETESSWLRHATEDAKSDDKGRRGGEGRGSRTDTAVLILLSTKTEMKWY